MPSVLISVSDKTGIIPFARSLSQLGWEILSTGGTYRVLQEEGIKNITEVSDFTGFPEGLEGRIKTLTPQVFGGILNLRNNTDHRDFCKENNIADIDMVVVNLYPFKAAYSDVKKTFEEKVEQIDIGGPSMIRAAAKNFEFCAPVVDPSDYDEIVQSLSSAGNIDLGFRKRLATKVFEMTAHYDLLIAKFWAENSRKTAEEGQLRYGENPHQGAVLLADPFADGANICQAERLNGKPLSYNNFGDAHGALELAMSFSTPFACIIKHASPCCAAVGETIESAFDRAYDRGDQLSAFGGIIALNRNVSKHIAEKIVSFFSEVVIAPSFDEEALEVFREKINLRVLAVPAFSDQTDDIVLKRVRGGTLVQDADTDNPDFSQLKSPTTLPPTPQQISDMETAWKIVKIVKSNAIVVVKDGALIGANGGQTSRVDAMNNALGKAGDRAKGAVIASDAFFPFPDSIECANDFGITAIVQPGGSKNDDDVFQAADKFGMSMILTGRRAFLH